MTGWRRLTAVAPTLAKNPGKFRWPSAETKPRKCWTSRGLKPRENVDFLGFLDDFLSQIIWDFALYFTSKIWENWDFNNDCCGKFPWFLGISILISMIFCGTWFGNFLGFRKNRDDFPETQHETRGFLTFWNQGCVWPGTLTVRLWYMAMDITEHLTKIMGEIIDINGCGYPPLSSPIRICWGPLDLFFWGSFCRPTSWIPPTSPDRNSHLRWPPA